MAVAFGISYVPDFAYTMRYKTSFLLSSFSSYLPLLKYKLLGVVYCFLCLLGINLLSRSCLNPV